MKLSLAKTIPALTLLLFALTNISWNYNNKPVHFSNSKIKNEKTKLSLLKSASQYYHMVYDTLHLAEKGLKAVTYDQAIKGFLKLKSEGVLKNDSVLTIVDFDQPSYEKRMYIIDVKNSKILFNTWAAHGKNSGAAMAESFSNTPESNKSSLGFYVTESTYSGSKGYSLKLVGLEEGLNTNAYERAIVLHGAPYVSQSTINAMGYIGRSHGCPAVAPELCRPIIEKIKNGSCLFIYNKNYHPTQKFVA